MVSDWTSGTITVTNLTPATRTLYYIYGDWMAAAPSYVHDSSAAADGTKASYSCASCHTTGYAATNFAAGKEPVNTYPGITTGITGSWDQNGIVCSRCHNATTEGTSYTDPFRAGLATGSSLAFSGHETDNL